MTLTLSTKFELDQRVWFMRENKPCEGRIIAIVWNVRRTTSEHAARASDDLRYEVNHGKTKPLMKRAKEHEIFATREEAVDSLHE